MLLLLICLAPCGAANFADLREIGGREGRIL
jgi:hypothetical protein